MGLGLPSLYGVEVAKPITDREIIESLAELKAGQKKPGKKVWICALSRWISALSQVDQRFEQSATLTK